MFWNLFKLKNVQKLKASVRYGDDKKTADACRQIFINFMNFKRLVGFLKSFIQIIFR